MIFNVIGKKNNQTVVSDADREIPTLGQMENAGKMSFLTIVYTYFKFGFEVELRMLPTL